MWECISGQPSHRQQLLGMLIRQPADGVPTSRDISLSSQNGKAAEISAVAKWMTKPRSTYDFLALLDPGIDFWHISLSFIIDLIDLILPENL